VDENDNVFRFGAISGGKAEEDEPRIPTNDYIITDMDNNELFGRGFLIFTPHHIAIMRDFGAGAVPVLVLPLGRIKAAELNEEEPEESVIPF